MRTILTLFIATLAVVAAATTALADDHAREGGHEQHEHKGRARSRGDEPGDRRATPPAPDPDPDTRALYQKECGACHLAFPPRLLPAGAHRKTLTTLDRHFGQNAELDEATRTRLEKWLVANASSQGVPSGSPRVTEQPWFRREHRKMGPEILARPSVRSQANCAACHAGAKDWDFEEERVSVPTR